MRILVLLLALALACHGEDRQTMLERLVETSPGAFVKIQTTSGHRFNGRLLAVEPSLIRIQTAEKAEIKVTEIRLNDVRSFRAKRDEGSFKRGLKSGAGGALAVVGVMVGISLIAALISAVAN